MAKGSECSPVVYRPASRLQCHALQEEPHARRALLQPGPTLGGAAVRSAADGLSPVAGEDSGRQR